MMKNIINNWDFKGTRFKFTWLPEVDLESIKPITQCYGFCYNDEGKLLVIETSIPGRWQVPGGTVEKGETFEETLRREIIEEANTTIKNIHYLGAQSVENDKNDEIIYQLRFAAMIDELREREPDPDKGIILERKFINPLTYNKLADWGHIGDELVRFSMEKLAILK
jgi:8-oxo-dGTP pyrophosphatase MutT (NUDIX family)